MKSKIVKHIALFACLLFVLSTLLLGISFIYTFPTKKDEETNGDTSGTNLGTLYSSNFDRGVLDKLIQVVYGNSSYSASNYPSISSSGIYRNASNFRSTSAGGKTSGSDCYLTISGLTWAPVALSKADDGDVLVTFWLTNTAQIANKSFYDGSFDGEGSAQWGKFYAIAGGKYSPNVYQYSYVRVVILNNGGTYYSDKNTSKSYSQKTSGTFAPFTTGSLSSYIEDAYYSFSYSATNAGAFKTTNNKNKLWLPDMDEIRANGKFGTSLTQRQNAAGSFSRTPDGDRSVMRIKADGSDEQWSYTTQTYGIRPCFHLNINEVVKSLTYTLTYNYNGGSGSPSSKQIVYGDTYGTLPTPTRTGYDFAGWYTASSGGSRVYSYTTLPSRSSTTIYAHWNAHTYTLNFDVNNGDQLIGSTPLYCTYGTPSSPFPTATRTGYTFLGWSTSSTATSASYSGGSTYSTVTSQDKAVLTLYAVWKANTYSVKFYGKGGSYSSPSSYTYTYDKSYSPPSFSWTGYTLVGWALKKDGNKVYAKDASLTNLRTEQNASISLYALWRKNAYAVTFDPNGGTLEDKYKNDYTRYKEMIGYKKNLYNSTKLVNISSGIQVSSGTITLSASTGGFYNMFMPFSDMLCPSTTYTVVIDCSSFSGSPFQMIFTSPKDTSPQEGLGDVSTDKCIVDVGGVGVFAATLRTKDTIDPRTEFDFRSYIPLETGKSYYAKFSIAVYTGNANMGNDYTTSSYNSTNFHLTLPTPVRDGYNFLGWFTSKTGGTQVDASTTLPRSSSITYYAHWEETWSNYVASGFNGGSGDVKTPYEIATIEQLARLAKNVANGETYENKYFILTKDLVMSSHPWVEIGKTADVPFKGIFDGQNHTISGYTSSTLGNKGLFGYVNKATITNVVLTSGTVSSRSNYAGGIVGVASNGSKITHCINIATISGASSTLGGIAGQIQNSDITLCANYGKIQCSASAGGIAGSQTNGQITNCYARCDMVVDNYTAAGITPSSSGKIANCGYSGSITGSATKYLIAYGSSATVTDCFAISTNTAVSNFSSVKSTTGCLMISGSVKKYYGTNFGNWVIATGTPIGFLPKGFSWIASGWTPATNEVLNAITASGFQPA